MAVVWNIWVFLSWLGPPGGSPARLVRNVDPKSRRSVAECRKFGPLNAGTDPSETTAKMQRWRIDAAIGVGEGLYFGLEGAPRGPYFLQPVPEAQ